MIQIEIFSGENAAEMKKKISQWLSEQKRNLEIIKCLQSSGEVLVITIFYRTI